MCLLSAALREAFHICISPAVLEERLKKNSHGKPALPDPFGVYFNISHSKGMAVCAVADEEIGVDIEVPVWAGSRLIRKVFTKREQEFLEGFRGEPELYKEYFSRLWTLKESYLKWRGTGFSIRPMQVSFAFFSGGGGPQVFCSDPLARFYQKKMEAGHILSLCGKSVSKEGIEWQEIMTDHWEEKENEAGGID